MGKDEVYLAALAGLLHDVGKFALRAGWQAGEHAEVGGEFVRVAVPEAWRRELYAVMTHHDKPLPDQRSKLVALADRLSAGERADETTAQPKQLLSIFCQLEADSVRAPAQRYLPLRPLALERKTLFPDGALPDSEVSEGYRELWQGFLGEATALGEAHASGKGDLATYLESLLLLMQRHTWCVPSAYYRSAPDVSLYDHSRMTAALAACMAGRDETWLDGVLRAPERSSEGVAVLIGGDISGVQEFIYTITAKGATPGLRGRSFYLQLLTEVILRYVLRRLDLPVTNLIYQGGGAFYLLARAADAGAIREIQAEISRVLLAHHRGALYVAVASVPLTAADFYGGRISDKWDEVARALRVAKQRRFVELGRPGLEALFEPQGHGGNEEQQCQVCGQEHPDTTAGSEQADDEAALSDDEAETVTRKCPQCRGYEDLGDELRRARYLWLAEQDAEVPNQPLEETPGSWEDVLAAFGYRGGVAARSAEVPAGERRLILALEDKGLRDIRPDARTAVGRRFLVNVTPVYRLADAKWLHEASAETRRRIDEELPQKPLERVKPFAMLEAQSEGIERLGVLRMDLDNGALLFSDGLVERDKAGKVIQRFATLSRIAALSFAISLYFEGWVEQIAEAMNEETRGKRGDTLYSIYSGGDDLFFVGAWDRVIELARRVQRDLTPFAAGHPGIHVSGGVVLVGGKYPLSQAAQDAGQAESAAKRGDKSALSFLGQVTPWKQFGVDDAPAEWLSTVSGVKERLAKLQAPEGESGKRERQVVTRRLIQMHELYEEAKQDRRKVGEDVNKAGKPQVIWGPWNWRGYYYLKRMTGKKTGEPWDSINALVEALNRDAFRAIEWIGLAARWAELEERERRREGIDDQLQKPE